MYYPTLKGAPNADIPMNVQQMLVRHDSLLESVAIIGAGAASYLGTKALEQFLHNECIGQCSGYVGGATFAAVASACSIVRYVYPDYLPTKHQVMHGLRDAARAIAFAASRR